MTKQESFKRRIRERMAQTGEKYGAARRQLIESAPAGRSQTERVWAEQPEFTDDAIREATGRGWNEWCDFIEAWPGHVDGHTAVAAYVHEHSDLDHWWSQGVTVSWERISGRRRKHQMADGTFTANKSKTVTVDADLLRKFLLSDDDRADLFPGLNTEMRSKPDTKVLRVGFDEGLAQILIEPRDDGRTKVVVAHEKLAAPADVERWKQYWADWLSAIDEG